MAFLYNAAASVASTVLGTGQTTTEEHQTGTEPVSGEQGSGTIAEPYDAGNKEGLEGGAPQTTTATASTTGATHSTQSGAEPVSGQTGDVKAGEPYDAGNTDSAELGGKAPQATAGTFLNYSSSGATSRDLEDAAGPSAVSAPSTAAASVPSNNNTEKETSGVPSAVQPTKDSNIAASGSASLNPVDTNASSASTPGTFIGDAKRDDSIDVPKEQKNFRTANDLGPSYSSDAIDEARKNSSTTSSSSAAGAVGAGTDKPLPETPTSKQEKLDDVGHHTGDTGSSKKKLSSLSSKMKEKLHIGKH